jgi:hypothetical protein
MLIYHATKAHRALDGGKWSAGQLHAPAALSPNKNAAGAHRLRDSVSTTADPNVSLKRKSQAMLGIQTWSSTT